METSSYAKCNYLYFIKAETVKYLINVIICPFLGRIQGSHNDWHGSCFKMQHFSISISSYLYLLILSYSLTDMLLLVGT